MTAACTHSQNEQLLTALRDGPLTAADIWLRLGIARASARVMDLRQDGWAIGSQMIDVLNRHGNTCRVALYSLNSLQKQLVPSMVPGRGRVTAVVARKAA